MKLAKWAWELQYGTQPVTVAVFVPYCGAFSGEWPCCGID